LRPEPVFVGVQESIPKNFTYILERFNVTRGNPGKYPSLAKNPPS
jgi:hypothetical protein